MTMTPDSMSAYDSTLSLQGEVLRALFHTSEGLSYTESANGLGWTTPERVARPWVGPSFVAYADRPIVFETETDVYARTRTS